MGPAFVHPTRLLLPAQLCRYKISSSPLISPLPSPHPTRNRSTSHLCQYRNHSTKLCYHPVCINRTSVYQKRSNMACKCAPHFNNALDGVVVVWRSTRYMLIKPNGYLHLSQAFGCPDRRRCMSDSSDPPSCVRLTLLVDEYLLGAWNPVLGPVCAKFTSEILKLAYQKINQIFDRNQCMFTHTTRIRAILRLIRALFYSACFRAFYGKMA